MTSPRAGRHRALATTLSLAALLAFVAGCSEEADPTPTSAADRSTTSSKPSPTETSEPSPDPSETSTPTGTALPVYYAGDAGHGVRLFREFQRGSGSDRLTEAARLVDGGIPLDPDYRTLWPGGTIASVEATDGLLVVRLEGDAFTEAPDGMPRNEARLAIQQLVYTLQGVQQARVPVQFVRDSGPTRLFGLDVSAPVKQASALKVLNLVNITSPEEGATVSGDTVEVTGVANSFEANVVCELVAGDEALVTEPFTAEGWMGDKLFPFGGELSLADAPAGEVLVRCSTDDPSGGAEGHGPMTDTKTLTVQ